MHPHTRRGRHALALFAAIASVAGAAAITGGLPRPVAVAASGPPTVSSVTPNNGPAGSTVTVGGSGFIGATSVQVGDTRVTSHPCPTSSSSPCFTVNSASSISLVIPPQGQCQSAGGLDVTVTTPAGTSMPNSNDKFSYNPSVPPTGGAGPTVAGIAVNDSSTFILPQPGTGTVQGWTSTPFFGNVTTLAGSLNTCGPSLVAVNRDSTFVMTANMNGGLNAPQQWSSGAFYGTRGTLLADVNCDGKADLVAVNDNSVWVMLGGPGMFYPPQKWSSATFYGSVTTLAADITRDGCADLVAVNGSSVWVMRSLGGSSPAFASPTLGLSGSVAGSRATLLANVSGSPFGTSDLIAVDDGAQYVMTCLGNGTFAAPQQWSTFPFYGTKATVAAHANSDKYADLLAMNGDSVWALTSSGGAFNSPSEIYGSGFYGSRATLGW